MPTRRSLTLAALCVACCLTVVHFAALSSLDAGNEAVDLSLKSMATESRRESREQPTTLAGVPKLLHVVHTALGGVDKALDNCLRLNSDWEAVHWTKAALSVVVSEQFQRRPDKRRRRNQRQRGFSWRLILQLAPYYIVHRYGGLFIEPNFECRRPLTPRLDNLSCYVIGERPELARALHNAEFVATNSVMGCQPGHPFFDSVRRDIELGWWKPDLSHLTQAVLNHLKSSPDSNLTILNPSLFYNNATVDLSNHCQTELKEQETIGVSNESNWKLIGCRALKKSNALENGGGSVGNDTLVVRFPVDFGDD